jgi:alpha-beta hydrolase superfamily lysophospholipase
VTGVTPQAGLHEEGELSGAGDLRLYTQSWLCEGEPSAAVVLAHGAGEHSARYGHVAARLTGEGLALHALDHRGHGRSEGRRAYIDRTANAVSDLDQLVVRTRERHPDVPLFLLGHSMGGWLAIAYVLEHQERLDGLLLSAPLAALEAASAATRLVGKLLSVAAPQLGIVAVDPTLVSRDPAVVKSYEEDPLVHHGRLPARSVGEFASAIEKFPERVPEIELPLLVMHGTGDRIVPPAASLMVHGGVHSEDKQLEMYDGLYHEILNEPEQDQVMDDVVGWIRARS